MNGLYLVTPDWDDTAALLARSEEALQAGVALLQYRHKSAGDTLRRAQAGALLALCRRYRTPFIVNDHIELCLELGADGVHLGGTEVGVHIAALVAHAELQQRAALLLDSAADLRHQRVQRGLILDHTCSGRCDTAGV